jgi:UDP-glucose 4-epimerase
MKILISGGAGFIGSHLAEILLDHGDSVAIVDNLSSGRYENIRHLENRINLTVGTIFNKPLLENIVKEVDFIFHLASTTAVETIMCHPIQSIETIIRGTSIVLYLAKRYRVPVLITSSSEVYGKGNKLPFSEDADIVLGPTSKRRWAYAASKAVNEFLALAYWQEERLPVICVRLFSIIGPRQLSDYGVVVPTFIKQALAGKDIMIHGDGEQTRCFSHVKDTVQAFMDLMHCSGAAGKVINIGSDEEISINTLAEKIKKATNSSSTIVHVPYEIVYPDGFEDTRRRVPDLSLAKMLINYQPRFGIEEIIGDIVTWKKSA